ncbi:MAG TPA: chemotaxis protein CheW [Spirochaetota bacterium]|nr:chemotaxis protein CheW [Spirochaetota bacterium]HPJ33816.1 chemotaxis protein CheW [Spirochaetota bacterium]
MNENKKTKQDDADNLKAEDEKQYVTFLVGDESYGVSVMKVQSINEMTEITYVPQARSFIRGVINLRGSVIPVIDMRKKFSLPPKDADSFTVILIVEVQERLIGMIADSVSDVVNIPASDIHDQINYSARVDTKSIEGIGRIGDNLIVLLDVDTFLSGESLFEG